MASDFSSDQSQKNVTSVDSDAANPAELPVPERDPFEELASDFAERQRRGELPSIEEYAVAHPELAEEIRELFPTIAAMEQLKERKAPPPKPTLGGLPLEQLGDFRILGEIGRGGMGVVYEAEQVSLARHVAVKVLPKQALLDERHLRRFQREAQTAAKLHHTNIVPVFGVGQQDGYHYIVMQFIPGVGLDEVLVALRSMVLAEDARRFRTDSGSRASHASHNAKALLDGNFSRPVAGTFSASFVKAEAVATQRASIDAPTLAMDSTDVTAIPEDVVESDSQPLDADYGDKLSNLDTEFYRSIARIGHQVADALAYAHEQGTLHRDIKPGNLLLDSTGTVWVADFGLAKLAEQDNVSRTGDMVGTLSYMPPESFSEETDARGDIYALGLTLFEMLALRPAFYGRDRGKLVKQITEGDLPRLGKLNPSIPRDLETIVLKAIAHRPEDRYATARDFADDLQNYLDDLPITARRMSVPEQFTRWCRKNKLVASLSASVLTLLVVTSVTFAYLKFEADQAAQTALAAKEQTAIAYKQATAEKENADRAAQKAREARAQTTIAYEQVKEEKENAKSTANEAIAALLSIFDGLAPDRLPLSADDSLQAAELTEELTAEASGDNSEETAATVAPPPVTEETAAMLKILLDTFERLAKRAGDDGEFAVTFADLTLRVGKLHKLLGKDQEALDSFESAIKQYEALAAETPKAIVGLAISYNEKGDVIARTEGFREAHRTYQQALDLLQDEKREPLLKDWPRAQYEKARTLFLMSVQREGRGFRGNQRPPRGEPERGGGPRGEGRPSGPGRRGGPGGPGGFASMVGGRRAQSNLQEAIGILNKLTETEADPEYRYLLARCHTGLSIVAQGPNGRTEQEKHITKAIGLLSRLVEENPDVADYKFEFAVAQLRSFEIVRRPGDEELEIASDVAELVDDIATKNPSVSNYAMVRALALVRQAEIFNQHADRLSRRQNPGEKALRAETVQVADKAASVLAQTKKRFPNRIEEVSARFPSLADFVYFQADVTEKAGNHVSAAELYRQILDGLLAEDGSNRGRQRRIQEVRVRLAKSLKSGGQDVVARSVAMAAREELRGYVELEMDKFELTGRDRNRRFHEALGLYIEAEYLLSGTEKAKGLLQSLSDKRKSVIQASREGTAARSDVAQLSFQIARSLRTIGQAEQADQLLDQIKQEMLSVRSQLLQQMRAEATASDGDAQVASSRSTTLWGTMIEMMGTTRILIDVLREQGAEAELASLFQRQRADFEELRKAMPERFRFGGSGRGGPRGGVNNGPPPRNETRRGPRPD